MALDAADSSTWVRRDGRWLCAMHTEAIAGDPFGRDRGRKPLSARADAAPPLAGARYDRSIVEGPLARAVWRLAWPTMLVNIIGGMQSLVDQVLVGHIIGFTGNAAIGVANQVFIAVFIFITSVFIGMSVLVSRFAGAGDVDKVNRTVYQACLTAIGIAVW